MAESRLAQLSNSPLLTNYAITASQNANVSAAVTATGLAGTGGEIDLTGANVTLASATLDASGTTSGGALGWQ